MDTYRLGYSGGRASFRLLIIGESGKGKTRLTAKIAEALAIAAGPDKVTILDFAPDYEGVGQPLTLSIEGVRLLRPRVVKAPRLMSKGDCSMAWMLARENASVTGGLLEAYLREPTPILVINDASIHLHAGEPSLLYKAVDASTVFVGNSYWGEELRDECGIWDVEAVRVNELSRRMDIVWRL